MPIRVLIFWPQLFSDVNCIALWISSEKILTRLYLVLHWFHKRLEVHVKNPRENRCFQTIIVCSFGSVDNSNKCTVSWKMAVRLITVITVITSVNKEMCLMLRSESGNSFTSWNETAGLWWPRKGVIASSSIPSNQARLPYPEASPTNCPSAPTRASSDKPHWRTDREPSYRVIAGPREPAATESPGVRISDCFIRPRRFPTGNLWLSRTPGQNQPARGTGRARDPVPPLVPSKSGMVSARMGCLRGTPRTLSTDRLGTPRSPR